MRANLTNTVNGGRALSRDSNNSDDDDQSFIRFRAIALATKNAASNSKELKPTKKLREKMESSTEIDAFFENSGEPMSSSALSKKWKENEMQGLTPLMYAATQVLFYSLDLL